MKVCFVHSRPIPPSTYGGTERILYWLIKELTLLGVECFLIGHKDSDLSMVGGTLIVQTDADWRKHIPTNIDLLHLFLTPDSSITDQYATVVTIHGNGRPDEVFSQNTLFLSEKHAANHGSTAFVYNGIDFEDYPYAPKKIRDWSNFMFLAKASWKVKNLSHCIKACRSNRKHLHVAGGVSYFPSRFVHNYGMIGQEKKLELLRSIDGLLFPVRWHEPFGVAVIEAMSQGVPVVGSPYGSLPELISEGSGLICENLSQFKEAIKNNHKFDPDFIRDYAETNFSSVVMAKNYLEYYKKALRGEKINQSQPVTKSKNSAEKLLVF
ncbi:MAG: glycosyltransferase [Bacteriovoracaceae bacterium]|nr:glycosyltransferase [Bacteriovoracaceae bacterium]